MQFLCSMWCSLQMGPDTNGQIKLLISDGIYGHVRSSFCGYYAEKCKRYRLQGCVSVFGQFLSKDRLRVVIGH